MTNKKKAKARSMRAKTGVSYQEAVNILEKNQVTAPAKEPEDETILCGSQEEALRRVTSLGWNFSPYLHLETRQAGYMALYTFSTEEILSNWPDESTDRAKRFEWDLFPGAKLENLSHEDPQALSNFLKTLQHPESLAYSTPKKLMISAAVFEDGVFKVADLKLSTIRKGYREVLKHDFHGLYKKALERVANLIPREAKPPRDLPADWNDTNFFPTWSEMDTEIQNELGPSNIHGPLDSEGLEGSWQTAPDVSKVFHTRRNSVDLLKVTREQAKHLYEIQGRDAKFHRALKNRAVNKTLVDGVQPLPQVHLGPITPAPAQPGRTLVPFERRAALFTWISLDSFQEWSHLRLRSKASRWAKVDFQAEVKKASLSKFLADLVHSSRDFPEDLELLVFSEPPEFSPEGVDTIEVSYLIAALPEAVMAALGRIPAPRPQGLTDLLDWWKSYWEARRRGSVEVKVANTRNVHPNGPRPGS